MVPINLKLTGVFKEYLVHYSSVGVNLHSNTRGTFSLRTFPSVECVAGEAFRKVGGMAGSVLGSSVSFSTVDTLTRFIYLYLNLFPFSCNFYVLVVILAINAKQMNIFQFIL